MRQGLRQIPIYQGKARAAAWTLRFATLSFAIAPPADAQDQEFVRAQLDWHLPPGSPCPKAATIIQEVEEILGREVFTADGAHQVTVRGRTRPSGTGWAVDLELLRADGSKAGARLVRTRAANCVELERSLPVVVALMVDLPRDAPRLQPPKKPERAEPEPEREPTPPAAPWAFRLGAGPIAGGGLVPGLGFGAAALVAFDAPKHTGVELELRGLQGRTDRFGGEASFVSGELGAAGCLRYDLATAVMVAGCAGLRGGLLHAQAEPFDREIPQTRPTLGTTLAAHASFALAPRWRLRTGLDGTVSVLRDNFTFQDETGQRRSFHEPSTLQWSTRLMLTYSWSLAPDGPAASSP